MVQIPRATSTGQLTTQTTAPRISDIDSFTRVSQELQKSANALIQTTNAFERLATLRETSRVMIDSNKILTEEEDRLLNDSTTTEKSAGEYAQFSEEVIQNQLATITNERARQETGVILRGKALTKGFNIKKTGRTNDIVQSGLESKVIVDDALMDAYKAPNEEQRAIVRGNLMIHFNKNLRAGMTTPKQIAIDLADYDERLRKGRAEYWLEALTAPGEGRSLKERVLGAQIFIERITQGEYSELTTGEEQELLNDAKNFVKRETEMAKIERDKKHRENEQRDAADILDEKIPLEQAVRDAIVDDKYSDGFISDVKAYAKAFNSPVAEGEEKIGVYVNIRKMQLGLLKKDDGSQYSQDEAISEVMRVTNGNLSISAAKSLVNKSFDIVGNASDNVYKREFNNLEAKMKVFLLKPYNAGDTPIEVTPPVIQAQIDTFLYRFDKRASAIENPTEEQLEAIAQEVYDEWSAAPIEDGGAGMDPSKKAAVTFGIDGTIKRNIGIDDSNTDVEVILKPKKKKK